VVRKGNDEVQVFYRGAQYAALHPFSSYFRMVYGPSSGWGTSVVLLPIYWSADSPDAEYKDAALHQGGQVSVQEKVSGPDLVLQVQGSVGELSCRGSVRIHPPGKDCSDPAGECIRADVSMSVQAPRRMQSALHDEPGEAFKPVFLSSMYVGKTQWDSRIVSNGVQKQDFSSVPAGPRGQVRRKPSADEGGTGKPTPGLIFSPDSSARKLILYGGDSAWKPNAPTVEIDFLEPSAQALKARGMKLASMGWRTDSADPNDDNIGCWLGTNAIIERYRYSVEVRRQTQEP
jgi:hypothetical protein